ncbi:alpha/beta fold hydrolase [Actinotalea ferrariae]|uniref:alpha/beta fold hydrolase n=1 Tax=Actinotalea ferrariae TaxID=1386098 RepID=UPI001C8CA86E|nr:alpha/beta fold hydrolase [Actinotalea ferrariae]MBX9244248.1 alpha/beta fold hydrolase [Actinotalea ferrariae]
MTGAPRTTGTTGRARGPHATRVLVERERVTVEGHDLWLTRLGPADGGTAAPVVLVHGIGVSGRYFEPLAHELALEGPVLVPDLPGFGPSPRPDEPLGIADHARVLVELVRREGWDSAPVLVGHSMGTQVVTEAAAAVPDLAAGVVLIGPVAEPGRRSAVRQGWRLLRDTRHETPRANWVVLTDYLRTGLRWYLATLPHMLDYPLEERIGDVTQPVLLLRGENDPIAPPGYVERLAARARDGRVDEVPGAGHVVMMRRPRAAAAMCRSLR